MEQWDRYAWICAHIPRFSKESKTFDDLQPLRKRKKNANLLALDSALKKHRDHLPETVTQEEFDAGWERFIKNG